MYEHDRSPLNDLTVAASFVACIRTGQPALDLELREIADRIGGIGRSLRDDVRNPPAGRSKLDENLASHPA